MTQATGVVVVAVVVSIAAFWGPPSALAEIDVSGTWDAEYSLTCDAVFNQKASDLSAAVNCGAGAAGTIEGSVDGPMFSLSGQVGYLAVTLEGTQNPNGSLLGTFSATPLAESGSFEAVRVDQEAGADLSGSWVITLADVLAGDCTVDIQQTGVELTTELSCETLLPTTLEGSLDGATIMLSGPFAASTDILLEGQLSEDGGSIDGVWRVSPGRSLEVTGTFSASRRGPATPSVDVSPTPLPELPSTGAGRPADGPGGGAALVVALLALGALALIGVSVVRHAGRPHS